MSHQQLDEEAIFQVARELVNSATRAQYLGQACAGDQALRERVEGLLEVHEREQDFLKSEPAPTAAAATSMTESPGDSSSLRQMRSSLATVAISSDMSGDS